MAKNIPVSCDSPQKSAPEHDGVGALPFQSPPLAQRMTQFISEERLKNEVQSICESINPAALDPDSRLGIEEIELALVVSGDAGVKLLGEIRAGAEASIRITLRRPQ